jgi:hypothetical protein
MLSGLARGNGHPAWTSWSLLPGGLVAAESPQAAAAVTASSAPQATVTVFHRRIPSAPFVVGLGLGRHTDAPART